MFPLFKFVQLQHNPCQPQKFSSTLAKELQPISPWKLFSGSPQAAMRSLNNQYFYGDEYFEVSHCHTFYKRKSLRNRLFSQKILRKKCRSFLGHFGSFLGHFGHFWAILGHICATLGHFGSFLGHFVAFLEKFAESSIFCGPVGVAGLAFRMYICFVPWHPPPAPS